MTVRGLTRFVVDLLEGGCCQSLRSCNRVPSSLTALMGEKRKLAASMQHRSADAWDSQDAHSINTVTSKGEPAQA
eukprot:3048847-Amphidinium_carterae.2